MTENGGTSEAFTRVVAVCMAAATLAGALATWTQTQIDTDTPTERARDLAVLSLAGQARATDAAMVQLHLFAQTERTRASAAAARRREILTGVTRELTLAGARSSGVAEREARAAAAIARASGVEPIDARASDGPQQPYFHTRYVARSLGPTVAQAMLRVELERYAARLRTDANSYGLTIAMYAIAIFLLGFSITPQGRRNRWVFAAGGVSFAIAASVLAALTALQPTRPPSEPAIRARAAANTAGADFRFASAAKHLSTAIRLGIADPGAYVERAFYTALAATPYGGLGSAPDRVLDPVVADLRTSRALGERSQAAGGLLAYYVARLGLARGSDSLREEAGAIGRRLAAEVGVGRANDPMLLGQIGFALLADGDLAGARRWYDLFARAVVYVDAAAKVRRDSPFVEEQYLSAALQDLELLQSSSPTGRAAKAIKARLVQLVIGAGRRRSAVGPTFSGLHVTVRAAHSTLVVDRAQGFDPRRDVLSEQWYRSEPDGPDTVVGGISGRAALDPLPGGGLVGRRADIVGGCNPLRRYRVELYVNGSLRAVARATGGVDGLHAVLSPVRGGGTGAGFCAPRSWRPSPPYEPGLATGYASPDGSRGAVLFRLEGVPQGMTPIDVAAKALAAYRGQLRQRLSKTLERPAPAPPFADLGGARVVTFGYGGAGLMRVGAVERSPGVVIIAAVYGPAGWVRHGPGDTIFGSFAVI